MSAAAPTIELNDDNLRRLYGFAERDPRVAEFLRDIVLKHPEYRKLEQAACAKSYDRFASAWLKLRPEKGGLARFDRPRPGQTSLRAVVRGLRKAKKPVRVRVLKPRQIGFSTDIEGDGFHHMTFQRGFSGMVIAHTLSTAKKLHRIFQRFHQHCPDWLRQSLGLDSRRETTFPDLDNAFYVETAKDAGQRGGTFMWLHCSEIAFWPGDPADTKTALYSSVPYLPGTTIYEETTANGVENDFYDSWWSTQLDQDAGKESVWTNFFTAWFDEPGYSMRTDERETKWIMGHLDKEERQLVERYNLSAGQLKWRRRVMAAKCERDINKFHQEFPSSAEEAFVSSGRPYFATSVLVDWKAQATPPPGERDDFYILHYPLSATLTRLSGDTQARPHTYEAQVDVFETPQPGMLYTIGADPMEGLESVDESGDPDFSVGYVIRQDTYDEVAMLRGQWDLDIFAEFLYRLGLYYNIALLAPETHAVGAGLVQNLRRRHDAPVHGEARDPYPNLYIRTTDTGTVHWGWETTGATKPLMLQKAQMLIRERTGRIRSLVAIREHMAMQVRKAGKVEVTRGHDDCLDARCIAIMATIETQLAADEVQYDPVTTHEKMMAFEQNLYERAQADAEPEPYLDPHLGAMW